MNTVARFSQRASSYTRFRWDFAAEVIQAVVTECGLSKNSVVADIGSGTGLLARHFAARVGTVIAVEPSPEMRSIAAGQARKEYQIIDGLSDATSLPDSSVDMVAVGRVLHWFPAHSTRTEWRRILKPEGWLAVFSIPCTDRALLDSMNTVRIAENGWEISADKARTNRVPLSFYFGHDNFRKLSRPGSVSETWDEFLGRISSFAAAPATDHPLRRKFEEGLRTVFDQYARDGVLDVHNATDARFGRVRRNADEEKGA